jgi:tetratricopeptide (TPR) repeat protein
LEEKDSAEAAKSNYKLGKSLYEQKAYGMAISALEEAIRLDPRKAAYYLQLGVCQVKIPPLRRKAEANFQKAVELEPWNAEHYAAMGRLFYLEKLNHKAESYFRKALQLDPTNALAKRGLAEVSPGKKSPLDSLQDGLKKIIPAIFDRKK